MKIIVWIKKNIAEQLEVDEIEVTGETYDSVEDVVTAVEKLKKLKGS